MNVEVEGRTTASIEEMGNTPFQQPPPREARASRYYWVLVPMHLPCLRNREDLVNKSDPTVLVWCGRSRNRILRPENLDAVGTVGQVGTGRVRYVDQC